MGTDLQNWLKIYSFSTGSETFFGGLELPKTDHNDEIGWQGLIANSGFEVTTGFFLQVPMVKVLVV